MTVFHKITSLLRRNEPDVFSVTQPTSAVDINVTLLTHAALTCRCGGMAIPTQAKGNQYRCVSCDKLMTHISYNLGPRRSSQDDWAILPKDDRHIIHMDDYDAAVARIKQMYGKQHRIS